MTKCNKCPADADAYWEHRSGRDEPLCACCYMRRARWILGLCPWLREVVG